MSSDVDPADGDEPISERAAGWPGISHSGRWQTLAAQLAGLSSSVVGEGVLAAQSEGFRALSAQLAKPFAFTAVRLPAYESAARALLDLDAEDALDVSFCPSDNDAAYDAVAAADPDLAAKIDEIAASVNTPFWPQRLIRNSLAWLLVGVTVALYVGAGTLLPPPWSGLVTGLLGASGVSAPGAYRWATRSGQDSPDAEN